MQCGSGRPRPFVSMLSIALLLLLLTTAASAQHLGFDRNDYPGDGNLATLHRTFAFTGYWLTNPPGSNANSWRGKRDLIEKAGFGFVVLFNGKTDAQLKDAEAESLGSADGLAAVEAAKNEGFPAATVIFLDQEEGGRLLPEQKAYLFAWMDAVNASQFRAGVYCSGIAATEGSSGETIITADDIRHAAEDRTVVYFVANDTCPPSPGCTLHASAPDRTGISYADVWQFAQSPRRKPQSEACKQTYAADGNCYPPGLKLHVDLDSATSADPSHGRRTPELDSAPKPKHE
jgi:Domain of unknown function (DUF1906)